MAFCPVPKLGANGKTREEEKRDRVATGEKHRKEIKALVWKRDKAKCRVCGKPELAAFDGVDIPTPAEYLRAKAAMEKQAAKHATAAWREQADGD